MSTARTQSSPSILRRAATAIAELTLVASVLYAVFYVLWTTLPATLAVAAVTLVQVALVYFGQSWTRALRQALDRVFLGET